MPIARNSKRKASKPDSKTLSVEESPRESPPKKSKTNAKKEQKRSDDDNRFIGPPVPDDEARRRWPHRYPGKRNREGFEKDNGIEGKDGGSIIKAKRHFTEAVIDGNIEFSLEDDAHVKAAEGEDNYICRIVEMFETVDDSLYFTAQWFYRVKDTVIGNIDNLIEDKRLFLSEVKDDNPLDCLVKRVNILRLPLNMDPASRKTAILRCDYYYDMRYLLPYYSFVSLPPETIVVGDDMESDSSHSTVSSDANAAGVVVEGVKKLSQVEERTNSEMTLLDLYSGCGAMSTGLCLGANMSGVNLVTRWAVDSNANACDSLKLNHPETEVRNESAGDFLILLKEWEKLCISFSLIGSRDSQEHVNIHRTEDDSDNNEEDDVDDAEVYEVERVLGICYGDPKESKEPGLYFKIRWKRYGPNDDSWEPIEGLGDCPEKIKEFVTNGYKSKILPLPGDVDAICGGPPCQGISGFNRFRNAKKPLEDPKNEQLVIFMDIVKFLKPRFVLMENVVDIFRFADGFLGRYALGRLVGLNYQARVGMLAAGGFGLPQYRMRVFIWGACPGEMLPQYPLPTHDHVVRGCFPADFESCKVAYEKGFEVELQKNLSLEDAISDLPPVENNEARDEMSYGKEPETEFQRLIRLRKDEVSRLKTGEEPSKHSLFDHRPLQLKEDDYLRVLEIPMKKGANFRDLYGLRVRDDKKVELDPNCKRKYLPSGKPLVPDYAISFKKGSSLKPFARLWWDEIVTTVVTRAEPHNQKILHPEQNRVLTIRENARLQGFPDYYILRGPVKESIERPIDETKCAKFTWELVTLAQTRYIQVGNAVAVPVARALGFALGLASKGSCSEGPLLTLPNQFPNIMEHLSS